MENVRTSLRRCVCIVLGLLLFAAVLPVSAFAECAETKTVRAGWYEDAYNITGEHGERSGYGTATSMNRRRLIPAGLTSMCATAGPTCWK